MQEFSAASYGTASINQICKRANIAKGSFYQYFADKLDLYVFVMTLALEEKLRFFSDALAEYHTLTLREQFRLLFAKGVEFAKNHPQYAALGERFSKETDETAKSSVMKVGNEQSGELFMQMIRSAKSKGEIDDQINPLALSMLLQSLVGALNEYILNKFGNLKYDNNSEDIGGFVDSLLDIIFNGIQNKNK